MKSLLLSLLLSSSLVAQTVNNKPPFDDWQFLEKSHNDYGTANIFFAPKTIVRNEDVIKVWMSATFPSGAYLKAAWQGPDPMPPVALVRIQLTLDCKRATVRNGETLLYDPAGSLLGKYKNKETVKEKPGTITWAVFHYFCERSEKPITAPTLKPGN